jgi:plasmid maintenance system antidote protein VapI
MLRSREKSREQFIEMRKHVMIKIEMLDEKHVRELGLHLRSMMEALYVHHRNCTEILDNFSEIERSGSFALKQKSFDTNDVENDEQSQPLISTDY